MLQAGDLDSRVTLSSPTLVADEYGNEESGFTAQSTVWARRLDLRGGEQVMAARLQGRQLTVFTVRDSSEMRAVQPEWQLTVVRTGTTYNVRSITEVADQPGYLDLLCESGVKA